MTLGRTVFSNGPSVYETCGFDLAKLVAIAEPGATAVHRSFSPYSERRNEIWDRLRKVQEYAWEDAEAVIENRLVRWAEEKYEHDLAYEYEGGYLDPTFPDAPDVDYLNWLWEMDHRLRSWRPLSDQERDVVMKVLQHGGTPALVE